MPATKLQPSLSVRYFKVLRMKSPFHRNRTQNRANAARVPRILVAEPMRGLLRWLKAPNTIGGKVHIRENAGRLISATRVKARPYMIGFVHLSVLSLSELGALLRAKTGHHETEMRRRKLSLWLLKRFPKSAAGPAAGK